MRAIGWVVLAVVVVGGCQNSAWVRLSNGREAVQLQGAELQLKRDLNIAARRARVFIQGGRPGSGFDHYAPHCAFEIDRVDHDGHRIRADSFRIVRVQGSLQRVVSGSTVLVADLALGGHADGSGSSAYHEGYHFWLASPFQPEVRRMSCYGVYAEPYELYPPTFEEIQGALGGLAEIRRR